MQFLKPISHRYDHAILQHIFIQVAWYFYNVYLLSFVTKLINILALQSSILGCLLHWFFKDSTLTDLPINLSKQWKWLNMEHSRLLQCPQHFIPPTSISTIWLISSVFNILYIMVFNLISQEFAIGSCDNRKSSQSITKSTTTIFFYTS